MPSAHAVATAVGRTTAATSPLVLALLVLTGLGLPASGEAAPVTWRFSGLTVAQTPFCSSVDVPCPSSDTYAFTGSVEFDPTTNQVFGMSVDVDYSSGLHYAAGAGTIVFGQPAMFGLSGTQAVLRAGSSTLTLAPFATAFSGPLTAPPSCVPLPDTYLPFTSSCSISVDQEDDGQRNIYGNVLSIQQVPEPAAGLALLTGMAMILRRFRRRSFRP